MPNSKPPHPDSVITVHGRLAPVLRASELRQRRQSDQSVMKALNPWGRTDNNYRAPELKTNPGIPPERMAAFKLPSRVGKRLDYPDGTTSLMPGADDE